MGGLSMNKIKRAKTTNDTSAKIPIEVNIFLYNPDLTLKYFSDNPLQCAFQWQRMKLNFFIFRYNHSNH